MKSTIFALVAIGLALVFSFVPSGGSHAQSPCLTLGEVLICTGSASADDALLFTSSNVLAFDACMLMSHDGAVDVEGSLNGTDFSAAVSLEDRSGTSTDKALATTADGMFAVVGKYARLRVRQAGATASAATMICWDRGR
jgi:hypothetical protein